MTACASCYARLRTANHKVRNDAGRPPSGPSGSPASPTTASVEVHHVLDVLVNHFGLDAIRAKVQPAAGRAAGGLLLRLPADPPAGDRGLRQPRAPDLHGRPGGGRGGGAGRLAVQDGMLRGQPVDDAAPRWSSRLGHKLLSMARQAGAECIAVACPLCQVNLDLRQADAAKAHGELPPTPVLYITQLLGLALGLSSERAGPRRLDGQRQALLAEKRLSRPPAPPPVSQAGEGSLCRRQP